MYFVIAITINTFTIMTNRTKQLSYWTLSWVASTALATFGPIFMWGDSKLLTTIALLLNVGIGIIMILANRNLFMEYDELQKDIHLKAMGITLGLTMVLGIAYSLMDVTNLISGDAENSLLIGAMGIIYLLSVLKMNRYYA